MTLTTEQINDAIDQLPEITGTGYDPSKVYTVYVNPDNRHILGMVGFVAGLVHLNDGNGFLYYNINDLTLKEYNEISRSINSTEWMTFLETDNRTVLSRRIYIDLMENTFFDANINAIYAVDNIVNLRVRCVDENLQEPSDIPTIEIKNIKKASAPISFNGGDPANYKTSLANPSVLRCELEGEGIHTIKVKALLPNVPYLFLTAFPQMVALNDEHQQNLKDWIAANL